MTRTIWKIAAVAVLAAGSSAAIAQQPIGPYVGISLGSGDISREVTDDYTYKTDKFTFGANFGWQFHPNFAAEVGYLGVKKISETVTDGTDTATITAKFHGWTASGIFSWPLGERWGAYGRVGTVRATEKYTASLNGGSAGSFADDTTEVLYGAGLTYLIQGARWKLDYQRAEFNYGKVGVLSIGLNWFLPTSR